MISPDHVRLAMMENQQNNMGTNIEQFYNPMQSSQHQLTNGFPGEQHYSGLPIGNNNLDP